MLTLELLTLASIAVVVLLVTLKGWPVLLGVALVWGLFHWYQNGLSTCRFRRPPEGPTVDVPPSA